MAEEFKWGKFFSGIVDPTAYFKTIAIVIRMVVICVVIFGAYMLCLKIHSMLAPKKVHPSAFHVTDQMGGTVKNSADQKEMKFGLLNF